jgi:hypothetical protein
LSIRTLITALYWTAIVTFVVGAGLRVVGGTIGIEALDGAGQIVCLCAWPVAVTAAVLDVRSAARVRPRE